MTERRTVPVAYVTKWAVTRGILVVKESRRCSNERYLYFKGNAVPPAHWTEDKAEAERRWWKAMEAAQKRLERQEANLAKALKAGPKWEET